MDFLAGIVSSAGEVVAKAVVGSTTGVVAKPYGNNDTAISAAAMVSKLAIPSITSASAVKTKDK